MDKDQTLEKEIFKVVMESSLTMEETANILKSYLNGLLNKQNEVEINTLSRQ